MSNSIDSSATQPVSPTDYAKFDPSTIHQRLNTSLSRPQLNTDGSIRHWGIVVSTAVSILQAVNPTILSTPMAVSGIS